VIYIVPKSQKRIRAR